MNGQSSRSYSSEPIDRIIEKGINFYNKLSNTYYGAISLLYFRLREITAPIRDIRRQIFRKSNSFKTLPGSFK